jgi:hypothetical protein
MKYLFSLFFVILLAGCSGSDGVEIKSASLQGVEATIKEDVAVGSTLSGELYITNAPYNLADVVINITGNGSEDFSVEVSKGVSADTFVGTITLIHSLMGKGGSSYSLTATATLDGRSLSAPIDISILQANNQAPNIDATPQSKIPWASNYTLTPANSGGVATYQISNKPTWASFDSTNGVLSGTPALSDLGTTTDINITATNDGGKSSLDLFSIEVTKRTPPSIESGVAKSLDLDVFNFPFSDDALWREHISKVRFIGGYGDNGVILEGEDYTIGAGNFALKIKDSGKVALHSLVDGGCEVRFEAEGYLDNSVLVGIIADGSNAIKVQISPQTPLSEINLNSAKIDITLLNQLRFTDNSLNLSKFTLSGIPSGVNISSVSYINDTSALLTLSFDGSDFDTNKTISLTITSDELNIDHSLSSNTLQINTVIEEEPTIVVPNFVNYLPADDSKNIAINSKVEFNLDHNMSDMLLELTTCSLTNMDSYTTDDFSLSYMGKRLILTPSSNLLYNHPYLVQCSITYGDTTKSSDSISFDTKKLFIPLMKTGIQKSYDNTGAEDINIKDDGYYKKGLTINRTRDSNITSDLVTGLDWNDDGFTSTRTVSSAKMYCQTLSAGGFDDWRLPTAKELQSLMIYDGTTAENISGFTNLKHLRYWSSTKAVESSSYNGDSYMIIKFPDFITDELETQGNHILCVRKR